MTKTSKTIAWIIGIIIVILIIVATNRIPKETSTIKLGFIGPLTGDVTSLGAAARAGVEIAVSEINAAGGINGRQIEMIYEDGRCSPVPANSAAQKLISVDKVTAIIGGLCSSETSAFVKFAMTSKVPVISYCSSAPSLSQSGPYFFRTYPSDAYQGKFAAEYAYNDLGARNISILYHISDWGTGIKDVFTKRFTELGGKIVATEGAPQESREYKTQLSKLKVANPDYLYMPLYTEGARVAIQQAQDLGIKTKILAADSWDDPKFVSEVTKNADIIYVGSTNLANDAFRAKIIAKTGEKESPICAPQAYDAVNTIIAAIKQVGTDADKLPDAIRGLNFEGVSGPISFDQNGDINNVGYVVKKIVNGVAVIIK